MKSLHLFYIEALLCLFMLFVCCSFFILFDDYKYQTAITAFNYSEDTAKILPFEVHPDRKFVDINIDSESDIKAINDAVFLMKEMKLSRDTIKGIRFIFNEGAKYESLITVLDIVYKEEPDYYMWKDNSVWICNTSEADRLAMEKSLRNYLELDFKLR